MFYLHDEPHRLRFVLVDRLGRDEIGELERSWRTAESVRGGRPLVVDARRLPQVDTETRLLLDRFKAAGAILLA